MSSPAFQLLEPLAIGGMAEVWTGRHLRSGRAVAIKVLTTAEARKHHSQAAFQAEARAAASLDHPAVAWVLDYGLLPPEWETQASGRLSAGSPYLVSEQARGGDLRRWVRIPPAWPTLRQALLSLLGALAFAHARGVIHRDLKPANVLLGTRREERHGVLLADFGIAHLLGSLPEAGFRARAGTPTFMAPEQIKGDWRAYGPWTDLYALGVLTWNIVQGVAPLHDAAAQADRRFIEWGPTRIATPSGLAGWLARLLRDDPRERFQRAADATAALLSLDDSPIEYEPFVVPLMVNEVAATLSTPHADADTAMSQLLGAASNQTFAPSAGDVQPLRMGVEPMPITTPEVPDDWRPRHPPVVTLELVDAGLGLYGLRDRPLIGRERERDRIWSRVRQAQQAGQSGVVLLNGPLGCGKSRLLRWLCERAEETGAALAVSGHLGQGPDAGLMPMLRRALRLEGLTGPALAEILDQAPLASSLNTEDRRALLGLIDALPLEARAGLSSGERYATLLRILRRVAGTRILVIALDQATEDAEGLNLAAHLLKQGDEVGGPVIIALAARDEEIARIPELRASWDTLSARPEVEALALGPLPPEDWPRLANAGLYLCPSLRQRVAARSAGNPLFAELLVGDWVQRGALVVGPDGFDLADDAVGELPESVSALVGGHLRALCEARAEGDVLALEVAAILGLEVDAAEWDAACRQAGLRPASDLLDDCIGRRLLLPGVSDHGFAFAQNMLREALLERARAGGRFVAFHAAAAFALSSGGGRSWEHAGRLGRHLLAAERPVDAVEPLLDAARGASLVGQYNEESALLNLAERALPVLPADRQDLAAARLWSLRGHTQQMGLGNRAEARLSYLRAIEAAERAGRPDLVLDTRRRLGGVTFELGDMSGGEQILRETLRQVRELGDPFVQSLTALDCCTILRIAGKREEAAAIGRYSRQVAIEAGLEDLAAINSKHSWYLDTLPDDSARIAALRSAIAELGRLNIPGHRAAALNVLGMLLRKRGEADEAMGCFRESLRTYEEIGASYASLPRYNQARVRLDRGEIWEAYPLLKRCLQELTTHRLAFFEPLVRTALIEIEFHTGDLAACDAHLSRVAELWRGGSPPEPEAAENLANAAAAGARLGHADRAREAYALAAEAFDTLGATAEAAAARAARQALPGA